MFPIAKYIALCCGVLVGAQTWSTNTVEMHRTDANGLGTLWQWRTVVDARLENHFAPSVTPEVLSKFGDWGVIRLQTKTAYTSFRHSADRSCFGHCRLCVFPIIYVTRMYKAHVLHLVLRPGCPRRKVMMNILNICALAAAIKTGDAGGAQLNQSERTMHPMYAVIPGARAHALKTYEFH